MTHPSLSPVTFLLVDDRPENLLVLEALLRRDGLELLKAGSGAEALELLLVHDVGLAIIDVRMPDMDGFELAELMRGAERSRSIPIIFVTASSREAQPMFDGYDAGAVDFLFKPIEPRILRNKVETFLQLCRQRQALAETLRFHETFVAAIGHDLRNPLNAIVMAAKLLAGSNHSDVATRRVVTRLLSSSERMSSMIDQLFDLSRSRLGGGIPLDPRPGDLVPALEGVVEEQSSTTSSPIELSCEGDATGSWDVQRLMQAVSNLLNNAARHGEAGAPIRVTLAGDEDGVTLEVHNRGSIPEETAEHLFEPFVSRPTKTTKQGLGLGLYIVDQIVRGHGGRVDVRSSAEEGTTFSIRVPRDRLP